MIDYIYALTETETNTVFYIGRTIHPDQRLKEHQSGARNYVDGDELKYQYANALDLCGVEWGMVVLMECGDGCEFYEDYFINLFRDSPLQNMRAGDSEPWMGRDYTNPASFVIARAKGMKARTMAKAKARVKRDTDVERTRFAGDFGKVAPTAGLAAILARRGKK